MKRGADSRANDANLTGVSFAAAFAGKHSPDKTSVIELHPRRCPRYPHVSKLVATQTFLYATEELASHPRDHQRSPGHHKRCRRVSYAPRNRNHGYRTRCANPPLNFYKQRNLTNDRIRHPSPSHLQYSRPLPAPHPALYLPNSTPGLPHTPPIPQHSRRPSSQITCHHYCRNPALIPFDSYAGAEFHKEDYGVVV